MTPEFAAPEQMTVGAITTAADVHALGGLLYRILTGGHPPGKLPATAAERMQAVVDVEPVRPSDIFTLRGRGNRLSGCVPREIRATARIWIRPVTRGKHKKRFEPDHLDFIGSQ